MSDAIRVDGVLVPATPAEVRAHVEGQLEGQHPFKTIDRWPDEYRESLGVFRIQPATPLPFQRKTGGIAEVDGVVSEAVEDMPLAVAKGRLKEQLAAKRWAVEVGGFSFTPTGGDPVTILTDRDSQSKFAGLFNMLNLVGAPATANWKAAEGFLSLSKVDAIRMTIEAGQHVQAAFDHEAELIADIDAAGDLDELAEIDIGSGWPS